MPNKISKLFLTALIISVILAALSGHVQASETMWMVNFDSYEWEQQQVTKVYSTQRADFYVPDSELASISQEKVESVADRFETLTMDEAFKFGEPSDVDGNGKITVLFQKMYANGYFNCGNLEELYNKMDVIGGNIEYVKTEDNCMYRLDETPAILAHELTHLINYKYDPGEWAIIQEGLATYVGAQSEAKLGVAVPMSGMVSNATNGFNLIPFTIFEYGQDYLLMEYLVERYGGFDLLKNLMHDTDPCFDSILKLLAARGYPMTLEELYEDFSAAMTMDCGEWDITAYDLWDLKNGAATSHFKDLPAIFSGEGREWTAQWKKFRPLSDTVKIDMTSQEDAKFFVATIDCDICFADGFIRNVRNPKRTEIVAPAGQTVTTQLEGLTNSSLIFVTQIYTPAEMEENYQKNRYSPWEVSLEDVGVDLEPLPGDSSSSDQPVSGVFSSLFPYFSNVFPLSEVEGDINIWTRISNFSDAMLPGTTAELISASIPEIATDGTIAYGPDCPSECEAVFKFTNGTETAETTVRFSLTSIPPPLAESVACAFSENLGNYVSTETSDDSVVIKAKPGAENTSVQDAFSIVGTLAAFAGIRDYSLTGVEINGHAYGADSLLTSRIFDIANAIQVDVVALAGKPESTPYSDLVLGDLFGKSFVAIFGDSRLTMTFGNETEVNLDGGDNNAAPTATNVTITGTAQVGWTLTGNYQYSDPENDQEGSTGFQWYLADSAEASTPDMVRIEGATGKDYTLTPADEDKYLFFEVIARAGAGTVEGSPAISEASDKVVPAPNAAPTATNVTITGTAQVGQTLTGSYQYVDPENDPEGSTGFQWYRADGAEVSTPDMVRIDGATGRDYTLTASDEDKYLFFEVTPRANAGANDGNPVLSEASSKVITVVRYLDVQIDDSIIIAGKPSKVIVHAGYIDQYGNSITSDTLAINLNLNLHTQGGKGSTGKLIATEDPSGPELASVTIPAGQNMTQFYFYDTQATFGDYEVKIIAYWEGGANPSGQIYDNTNFETTPLLVYPGVINKMVLEPGLEGKTTSLTYEAIPIRVLLQDQYDNVINREEPLIMLETDTPDGGFYCDQECNLRIDQFFCSTDRIFFYKSIVPGTINISVNMRISTDTMNCCFSDSKLIKVLEAPAKIQLNSQDTWSIQKRGKITVNLQKADGTTYAVPNEYTSGLNIHLGSDATGDYWTTDVGTERSGTVECPSVHISPGSSCTDFYYCPFVAGTITLNAWIEGHDEIGIIPITLDVGTTTTINKAPFATNVTITGTAQVGQTLTGSYQYVDPENDPEGSTGFQWYWSDSADASTPDMIRIDGATGRDYTLTTSDQGKYMFFEVIPRANAGTTEGMPSLSVASNKVVLVDECFIATAAFGSKYYWPVALLRNFRDECLLTNGPGKAFVAFYYKNSPPIAEFIAGNEPLKLLVRCLLAPLVGLAALALHPVVAVSIFLILSLSLLVWRKHSKKTIPIIDALRNMP